MSRLRSNLYEYCRGAFDLRIAQQWARDGYRNSCQTLSNILRTNANTDYSRTHGLTTARTIADFRAAQPLTRYSDYREILCRMACGEKGLLTSLPVTSFLLTAGTTDEPKLIPRVMNPYRSFSHHRLVQHVLLSKVGVTQLSQGPSAYLMSCPAPLKTNSGIPILPLSYLNFQARYANRQHLLSSPGQVFELTDLSTALDLHILFALKARQLTSVSSTFLPVVLDRFFNRMRAIGNSLHEAIATGSVDALAPRLPTKVRRTLNLELHGPDPTRAREFRAALDRDASPLGPAIWPKLCLIRSLASASFSVGRDALKQYVGGIPIMSPVYSASEAFLGFSVNPESDATPYVLATEDAFLEFLPTGNESLRETYLMNELLVGEVYEIILTNFEGFYRYRLGDLIRVIDFWGETPVVELLGRVGQALNLFGEKTPENSLTSAVREMAISMGVAINKYVATVAWAPARYVVYAELTSSARRSAATDFSLALDHSIRHWNPDYDDFRQDGSLDCAQLRVVPQGTISDAMSLRNSLSSGLQDKDQTICHSRPVLSALDAAAQRFA